jgi:hypothetical protein
MKYLLSVLIVFSILLFMYLLGCFYFVTFNIGERSDFGRFHFVIISPISLFMGFYYFCFGESL